MLLFRTTNNRRELPLKQILLKKMMSNNNLVNMNLIIFTICLTILVSLVHASSMADDLEDSNNPLMYETASREEMAKMAGYGEEKLSTVLVTGTLLCEACFPGESNLRSWPISGATVAARCNIRSSKWSKTSLASATTDEFGDFLIDLPSHLHGIPNLDKFCSFQVQRMPRNSNCRPAYVRKQRGLVLSSVGNGIRNYTAGKIKFLHLTSKPRQSCSKRSSSY